jgi:GGDEF domain-containing protein
MSTGDDIIMQSNAAPEAAAMAVSRVHPPSAARNRDGVVARSIVRHFSASLAERRRLLLEMWTAFRANPHDRAARARLSRHLRVLGDAAWRAGAAAVENCARVADRNLPHASETGVDMLDPMLDRLLDAMATISQQDAPAIAARMPMVVFDGVCETDLSWLLEILVASGTQVYSAGQTAQLPLLASGHLVVLAGATDLAGRIGRWRELGAHAGLPLRIVLLGNREHYAQRSTWLEADAVVAGHAEPQALLRAIESELCALREAPHCIGVLGIERGLPAWVDALAARGFLVASAGCTTDLWQLAQGDGLDAVLAGPGIDSQACIALARTLSQEAQSGHTSMLRLAGAHDDAVGMLSAGIEILPPELDARMAADALSDRMRRQRRMLLDDTDTASGALRRGPFLRLMQGMLEGPAAFVGIGVIDLDGLRALQQDRGRGNRDQVLRAVAQRLRAALPATAALGWAGSDAFLFGFTARNEAEARRLMAQAASPPTDSDKLPRISHCIGGVLLDRDDRTQRVSLSELVARAGEMVLEAKLADGSRIALARYGERPVGERWF